MTPEFKEKIDAILDAFKKPSECGARREVRLYLGTKLGIDPQIIAKDELDYFIRQAPDELLRKVRFVGPVTLRTLKREAGENA